MFFKIVLRFLLIGLFIGVYFSGSVFAEAVGSSAGRLSFSLNTSWAFHRGPVLSGDPTALDFDDSHWEGVSIPHVMQVESKHNGGQVYQGLGWYRRFLSIPNAYKDKRVTIDFQGVQMNCEVFLNGEKIAENFGGYIGFLVDISSYMIPGRQNLLAVKVISVDDAHTPPGKPMDKLDFNYYGGIYRDVDLVVTNGLYLTNALDVDKVASGGVRVSYPNISDSLAMIDCHSHVMNAYNRNVKLSIETTLLNKEGIIVAHDRIIGTLAKGKDSSFYQQLRVVSPSLWHPDHPSLYSLETKVYVGRRLVDNITTRIGIRSLSFASKEGEADGFYINGQKLYIRGANRHQAFPHVGDAASNSMQYRDALLIKKGGFNAVRAAHYPASPAFLDACDEIGLLVVECQPSWQYYSHDSTFVQRSYRDIRRMVRRDRNHPSVFLWETSLNESPTPASWMQDAVRIAHDEMPGNQCFTADDFNIRSKDFYDVLYKVVDRDGKGPLPHKPLLTREWGDAWYADPAKENGLRASRMYSEKGLLTQCVLRQNALNGETKEELGGYWDHAGLDANPRISGYFLWSFNDYTRGYDPVTAFSGVVDLDRHPKFGYYQMQAMQDARNPVYGPMVFVASYNRPTKDSSVVVFSNCDEVRLYQNGNLVGHKTRVENASTAPHIAAKGGSPYFRFELPNYRAGELSAEGILEGKAVCTNRTYTGGQAHSLKIEIADLGVSPIADGSDMVPFYVIVCDKDGNPTRDQSIDQSQIHIKVTGEGKLIGGNYSHIGVNPQHPEGGIAYGLIRTSENEGRVLVQVSSEGMKEASLQFTTVRNPRQAFKSGHKSWVSEYDLSHYMGSKSINTLEHASKIDLSRASIYIDGITSDALSNLVDSKISTIWTAGENVSALITIDIGKIESINAYRIYWGKDSDWYTYSLEASLDSQHWEPLLDNTVASGQDYAIKPIKVKNARYLQIRLLDVKPENSTISIREIELYKDDKLPQ